LLTLDENISKIKQLSCFDIVSGGDNFCSVEPIATGLSHSCFKVSLINSTTKETSNYFVKSLTGHENTSANEVISAKLAMAQSIAPKVIFSSTQWLVTDFVNGQILTTVDISTQDKISTAIALIAKFHQAKANNKIHSLSIEQIVKSQISSANLTVNKQVMLKCLCEQILAFDEGNNKVLCHGDVNFSNILIDKQRKAWLIDFECSFIGCAEFDLAMFIAVNHLPISSLPLIISHYQQTLATSYNTPLNKQLIHAYLACCYLINGLWYQNNALSPATKKQYLALALQQYKAFDQLQLSSLNLVSLLD